MGGTFLLGQIHLSTDHGATLSRQYAHRNSEQQVLNRLGKAGRHRSEDRRRSPELEWEGPQDMIARRLCNPFSSAASMLQGLPTRIGASYS